MAISGVPAAAWRHITSFDVPSLELLRFLARVVLLGPLRALPSAIALTIGIGTFASACPGRLRTASRKRLACNAAISR